MTETPSHLERRRLESDRPTEPLTEPHTPHLAYNTSFIGKSSRNIVVSTKPGPLSGAYFSYPDNLSVVSHARREDKEARLTLIISQRTHRCRLLAASLRPCRRRTKLMDGTRNLRDNVFRVQLLDGRVRFSRRGIQGGLASPESLGRARVRNSDPFVQMSIRFRQPVGIGR